MSKVAVSCRLSVAGASVLPDNRWPTNDNYLIRRRPLEPVKHEHLDRSAPRLELQSELFLERLGLSSVQELPPLAPLLPDIDAIDDM